MAKVTVIPVAGVGESSSQRKPTINGGAPRGPSQGFNDPTASCGRPSRGEDTRQHSNLVGQQVAAGFPSPADDYLKAETPLDLNEHLIKHPAATFFVRVRGDSMTGCGIFPDDILIVDRSLEPAHRKVVIAVVNGELTVKRLHQAGGKVMLMPENAGYQPIVIEDEMELEIWGVVTCVIHPV